MKRIFVDINWLWKFLEKEGRKAYNSLMLNNKIISNGKICTITFEVPDKLLKNCKTTIQGRNK